MEKPELGKFPQTPGVYLYHDQSGRIIYVGKARKLRNRIASYFREESGLSHKTRLMLKSAVGIEILTTSTEKEALLLEASLIKKHRPRYNIVLRDDKEYLLFRIGREHPYPRVEIIRQHNRKSRSRNAAIFGPFSSGGAARETWRLIHKYFPMRRCTDRAFANRTRPCLYFDIGQCLAPCVLPVSQQEYATLVRKVTLLLSGRSSDLIDLLHSEMHQAADAMEFEKAARVRDQMYAVERTLERQSVVLSSGTDLDVVGVSQVPEGLALGICYVRDGRLIEGRNFFWPGLSVEDTPELIAGFLNQFYLSRQGLGESIPGRIIVPWLPETIAAGKAEKDGGDPVAWPAAPTAGDRPPAPATLAGPSAPGAAPVPDQEDEKDLNALASILSEYRGSSVTIHRPRTPDEDRLALLAATNAREAAHGKTMPVMAELLAERLQSKAPIRRIEVVDISHTAGRQTRAGMVVYEDETPVTQDFRNYSLDENISEAGAEAGDDYAALAAWACRRARSGPPWPDLILIDGGKGQLAAVRKVFRDLGLEGCFQLASIAKARTEEGFADRRAGNTADRIFLPDRANPAAFPAGSPELLYLQRIRDAAHDFVLGRHRRARAAATLSGELVRLPGIGPKLARELFNRFGSLAAMAEAGEDELMQTPGIGRERATLIRQRLALLVEKKKA